MSWARTSNFTLMPNKTVCSSAVGRRKRALPFCIPPRARNLFRVVPQKVLTLQFVNSGGGGRTRPTEFSSHCTFTPPRNKLSVPWLVCSSAFAFARFGLDEFFGRDRKSTRLNSSH